MADNEAAADSAAENDSASLVTTNEGSRKDDQHEAGGDDEIEVLKAEAAENWSKYLRAVAELDNLRKRSARDIENARKYGAESLVSAILPVRDSLEAALNAAAGLDPDNFDLETVLEGDRATLRLLDQALESAGLNEIDPEGEPFDPEHHEAMSMQPSDTAEPNSVIAVIQKGYALHGRIVRPARVIVAKTPTDSGNS